MACDRAVGECGTVSDILVAIWDTLRYCNEECCTIFYTIIGNNAIYRNIEIGESGTVCYILVGNEALCDCTVANFGTVCDIVVGEWDTLRYCDRGKWDGLR